MDNSLAYHPDHPVRQMGRTNYAQQRLAYYLSANREKTCYYATLNKEERLQLFWWNFPHLIITPIETGFIIKFPQCGV